MSSTTVLSPPRRRSARVTFLAPVECTSRIAHPLPGEDPSKKVNLSYAEGETITSRWRKADLVVFELEDGMVRILVPEDVRSDAEPYSVYLEGIPAKAIEVGPPTV